MPQCLNPDGSVGNDPRGTLVSSNVVFGGADIEGYAVLAGLGAHLGGFIDMQTWNYGMFFTIDAGTGYGGSLSVSGGAASRLSEFQGLAGVSGVGIGPGSVNYV